MIKFKKMFNAFLLFVTVMIVTSVSAFAASPVPVVVNMTGSGAGFSTTDLLTNTGSFLIQYSPFIVLIAAVIFARPLLNFIFFIIEKASPRYRENKRFNDMHEKIMSKMKE
jgi:hypothetical protein